MHFELDVVYPNMTQQQCLALHENEEFQRAIAQAADTTRSVMWQRRTGNCYEREAEFIYKREVEGSMLRAFVNTLTPTLGHVEYSRYDGPQGGSWSIRGHHNIARLVSGQGTVKFIQRGNDVVRRVEGSIDLKAPALIRKAAEPQIRDKVLKGLRDAAAHTPIWLQTHPMPSNAPQAGVAAGLRSEGPSAQTLG